MISGEFPSKFLKCSFYFWSFSSWLVYFSFAFKVLFFRSLHLLSAMLIVIVYILPNLLEFFYKVKHFFSCHLIFFPYCNWLHSFLSLFCNFVFRQHNIHIISVHSVGAVGYTNCIQAEGLSPPLTNVLDMTLNNLIVRLQSWSFRECWVHFHCHCFQAHSGPDRIISVHQIELFDI